MKGCDEGVARILNVEWVQVKESRLEELEGLDVLVLSCSENLIMLLRGVM